MGSMRDGAERCVRSRIAGPLAEKFTQGASPQAIAECVVLGALIGVIPLLGTSSVLLTLMAVRRRLNMPAIHAVNWLMAVPQFVLWIPFMRLGERLFCHPPLDLSVAQIRAGMDQDGLLFVQHFGMAVMHALTGWIVLGLPLAVLGYLLLVRSLESARAFRRAVPRA